ncbi:MAG: sigma 54-interacting transcriptional regulator [Planctomycetes bacterium]|nr:sigma 54-interacting transcriptional regulator [Planctomycetota bacterium]
MIRVVIIVPYPELQDKANEIVRANPDPGIVYEVTHTYGTAVDSMNVGHADIVLARGLTQQAIKRKYKQLTVLDLTVGAYDVLRAVHACRRDHGVERIAILGSDTLVYDLDTLKELVQADLKVFIIRNEKEILAALALARAEGFQAVVGGLTACHLAEADNWPNTVIRTSEETLRVSIKEAMNTATVMQHERARAEISRVILQHATQGILYFNQDGYLMLHNERVFTVLNLPPEESLEGRRVDQMFADPEILELVNQCRAAYGVIKTINQSMIICDFVPVRVDDRTIGVICTFSRVNEIQATETRIRKELSRKGLVAKYGFNDIVHASPSLARTIATANKYGQADANVLIIGETGTGKELFAQSIHNASRRSREPFVALNCAAFPENLLESELFGYAEGAFSGAVKGGKTGLFELAHGGSMFLDEIGEMPMNLQATLLRALQEGEIRKIGDDKVIPVNVRIIAATNQDLRQRVRTGGFRMDLLYRLDVLSLHIPPLRTRPEDIGHIALYYIKRYCLKYNKMGLGLSEDALEAFAAHDWPGNTRELRNVCERLAVLGEDGSLIDRDMVASVLGTSEPMPHAEGPDERPDPIQTAVSTKDIDKLVQMAEGMRLNKTDIAAMLGISRTTLWRRRQKGKLQQ